MVRWIIFKLIDVSADLQQRCTGDLEQSFMFHAIDYCEREGRNQCICFDSGFQSFLLDEFEMNMFTFMLSCIC